MNVLLCIGQSGVERVFLAGAAGLVLFLCCLLLFIECVQLYQRLFKYFKEFDNYFQVTVVFVTIIFVAPGFSNDCWCAHNWQWQIGALALCLGWFNLIILLKDIPYTAIPINMFINICITFLKVLFLPFLLLMAFALPFYMIFVRTVSASEVRISTSLHVNQVIHNRWTSFTGNRCSCTGLIHLSCSCYSEDHGPDSWGD